MVQKPIIHMQLNEEKPPFDLSLYRAVKFSRIKYNDLARAQAELKKAVSAVLENGYEVENPVTHARGRFQLQEHATPSQQVLLDQFRAIEQRLERLERLEISDLSDPVLPMEPTRPRPTTHDQPFKLGELAFHQKFGVGPVVDIDGAKLTVNFPVGVKRVISSFLARPPIVKR